MSNDPTLSPEQLTSVIPHLVVRGGAAALEFYRKAFGAVELARAPAPGDTRLMHAAFRIGSSILFLCDEFPEMGPCRSPASLGGSPVSLSLYVADADRAFAQAVEAGATVTMPLMDMFWGDRYGKVVDPFGHEWAIAQRLRQVSAAECEQAARECFAAAPEKELAASV